LRSCVGGVRARRSAAACAAHASGANALRLRRACGGTHRGGTHRLKTPGLIKEYAETLAKRLGTQDSMEASAADCRDLRRGLAVCDAALPAAALAPQPPAPAAAGAAQGPSLSVLPQTLGVALPLPDAQSETSFATLKRWRDAAIQSGAKEANKVREFMEECAMVEEKDDVLPKKATHLGSLRTWLSRRTTAAHAAQ
jgi:hypothetical protein